MPGTIDFRHDAANDIVIAVPKWTIQSKDDCEVWFGQWVAGLSKYGRKVDCVVVLDDFHVDTQIASTWGEYRARLNNIHSAYRVDSEDPNR